MTTHLQECPTSTDGSAAAGCSQCGLMMPADAPDGAVCPCDGVLALVLQADAEVDELVAKIAALERVGVRDDGPVTIMLADGLTLGVQNGALLKNKQFSVFADDHATGQRSPSPTRQLSPSPSPSPSPPRTLTPSSPARTSGRMVKPLARFNPSVKANEWTSEAEAKKLAKIKIKQRTRTRTRTESIALSTVTKEATGDATVPWMQYKLGIGEVLRDGSHVKLRWQVQQSTVRKGHVLARLVSQQDPGADTKTEWLRLGAEDAPCTTLHTNITLPIPNQLLGKRPSTTLQSQLELAYVVGEGNGHRLHMKDATLSLEILVRSKVKGKGPVCWTML